MRIKTALLVVAALFAAAPQLAYAASVAATQTGAGLAGNIIPKTDNSTAGQLDASSCTDDGTTVICTEPFQAPAKMTVSSGAIGPTGNANIVECSTTCTVTFPAPVAGSMQCVRNEAAVTTIITIAAITSVLFEKTDNSAYGTVTTGTMVSTNGEVSSKVCLVGRDTTHYDVFSFKGTWTNS